MIRIQGEPELDAMTLEPPSQCGHIIIGTSSASFRVCINAAVEPLPLVVQSIINAEPATFFLQKTGTLNSCRNVVIE